MTTIYVLGSGSSGNCLALESAAGVLLVDAGFSAKEIGRRAARVALDLGRVVGIALTHEHTDHTAGAARLARTLRVPVLTSPGTWDRLRPAMPAADYRPLRLMGQTAHAGFLIEAAPTSHYAAEPVALAVTTPAGHRIGLAYDLGRPTTGVRYLLRGADALVLEANHDDVLLRTSGYPPAVQERIAGSGGHLSNRAAAELVEGLVHPGLAAVVLAHLSERCNSPAEARAAVELVLRRAGHSCSLHVARQDEPLAPVRLTTRYLLAVDG